MIIDATFWVAISFLIFIALLIYFKIPLKVKNIWMRILIKSDSKLMSLKNLKKRQKIN